MTKATDPVACYVFVLTLIVLVFVNVIDDFFHRV